MFVCAENAQSHQSEIRLLTSKELWHWERSPANPLVVDGVDARDPYVVHLGGQWAMYYAATSSTNGGSHVVASVITKDLLHWANRRVVFTHPGGGASGETTESPFVVRRGKSYYLFVCDGRTTTVYLSTDPFHWDSEELVGRIQAHAAEVVRDRDGFWFISHAGSEHGGLSLARLIWHDGLDGADSSLKPGD
jgi:beta-fructofuranosidase